MTPVEALAALGAAAFGFYTLAWSLSDCDLILAYCSLMEKSNQRVSGFQGRKAWVTGASSGIGRAVAKLLAKSGADVVLSARRTDALEQVKKEILSETPTAKVYVLPMDLADLDTIPEKTQQAVKLMGGVDVLINNGGISQRSMMENSSFDVFGAILTVNFFAAARTTKELIPHWVTPMNSPPNTPLPSPNLIRPIRVVNIASLAGKLGAPLRTAYCASKFGLVGFSNALRAEMQDRGVTVTSVCPGSVKTDVARNALMGTADVKYGGADPIIESGMDVERCARLTLISAANGLDEVWMFASFLEKFITYFSQYAPYLFSHLMRVAAPRLRKRNVEEVMAQAKAKKVE